MDHSTATTLLKMLKERKERKKKKQPIEFKIIEALDFAINLLDSAKPSQLKRIRLEQEKQ